MSFTPGTLLGPYEILSTLGIGGMGQVYKVRDTRLGREVALKVLPPEMVSNPERKQRFLHEAQTASSLNHPNIITIFDVGSESGVDFIVMEYVKGKTLDQLISRHGLPVKDVLKYSVPIADGLAKAHSAGIIHRDLKPGNVMLSDDGEIKLLDFGLAKLTENGDLGVELNRTQSVLEAAPRTIEGTILGTVSYMSPEQAEGKKIDPRSDIFSFGALLYEMVTGQRAFQNDSTLATLSAILREEPQRIGAVVEGVPAELERVVSRCLRKDPDRRWQSLKDVKVALQELKDEVDSGILVVKAPAHSESGMRQPAISEYVNRAPAVTEPSFVKPTPPRKLGLLLTAGAVLLAGAAGSLWWWSSNKPVPASGSSTQASREKAVTNSGTSEESILSNDQIIEMVKAGISPNLILAQIRSSKTAFNLSTSQLIRLAREHIPENVIEAMRNPQGDVTAMPGRSPDANLPVPQVQLVTLSDGAVVRLILMQDISPAASQAGERIKFKVASDVREGDAVLIAKGAPAVGVLAEVEKKKFYTLGGKVTVQLESVKAVDGQSVRIRATAARSDGAKSGKLLTLAKGKDIEVSSGAVFKAYTDGDKSISVRTISKIKAPL